MAKYTISFGEEPSSLITRSLQMDEIYQAFLDSEPQCRVFMLTGVRGSGKTVCLSQLSSYFSKQSDWLAVDLNPQRNLLMTLCSSLHTKMKSSSLLEDLKLNVSLGPVAASLNPNAAPIDIADQIELLLDRLKRQNKSVLFTIDEVSNTPSMQEFAAQFQIWARKKYNVFLVMAGLYENVDDLSNDDNLTFLNRAPKIYLQPLNRALIQENYEKNLGVSAQTARSMAEMTKGYPYAFQALGYVCERHPGAELSEIIPLFDALLQEGVYEKMWSELSDLDRKVIKAMADISSTKVKEIREQASLNSSLFSTPRKRLLRKGILVSPSYGHLAFTLPRFAEYIQWETDEDK